MTSYRIGTRFARPRRGRRISLNRNRRLRRQMLPALAASLQAAA
jgi:hypothetical protein